jgi:hypothetical protein
LYAGKEANIIYEYYNIENWERQIVFLNFFIKF